ncbi:MAG: hypothetical protein IJX87_04775, partial [Clostridia bacterium]|nr:hypothetical protein [Clostridia bacterium]
MKKAGKYILVGLMTTLFALGLAACGENRTPNQNAASSSSVSEIKEPQQLATPKNVTVFLHEDNAIDIDWEDVENASGYCVMLGEDTYTTQV